jgi:hypothetical protein
VDRLPSVHPSSQRYEHARHESAIQDLKGIERTFSDEESTEGLDEGEVRQADQKLAEGSGQELAAAEGNERRDVPGASPEAVQDAQERLGRTRDRGLATDRQYFIDDAANCRAVDQSPTPYQDETSNETLGERRTDGVPWWEPDAAPSGERVGHREVPQHEHAVDAVCARLEITDPENARAVGDVYSVTYEFTAPFVVKVADDMLVDLRAEVERNPNLTIAFLGRDGHCLAVAARRLDPEFYAAHGREVVLSRSVVEAAVQDLETNAGKTFPEIDDFRAAARKVDPETVDGARQRLTEYLQTCGIPVGNAGSEVALVDTSYKGTVQELLTATYSKTSFQGRYVFFGAPPHDTHPDAKKGYALHLDAEHSEGGRPVSELPTDERLVLSHQDAIGVIEETLHGPWTSPRHIRPTGRPEQRLQRHEPEQLDGLNPVKVADQYKDPCLAACLPRSVTACSWNSATR